MRTQAAAMLFELQLLLAGGATDAFETAHATTHGFLSGVKGLAGPLAAQLRLHCAVLHALYLLRRGRTAELQQSACMSA